ncbi:2Fe-2S iron-sulfur cluster binding domain-containing protein [Spirosoma sp. BT702]|uniref:2Fe-2S iron-sulfur cluster binding domain-containing protein n=1 Tax=Spirosoma profusum TaxID=2771354 RepID=A0A927ASV7_9BACT|nr:2Fe-2S iron-sulfur cluster-binding protein [Spirosoma profusum]MBD2704516.1 2Fe-2S iron-sulfur cluster binding domain-containing protein [Spirosoma profusum]
MIHFTIEDRDGTQQPIEIPEGINLSLMEVLKASEYDILATCGGMALCATCHVKVLDGFDDLPSAQDAELDMLDTLPDADSDSRLACQIRVDERLNGATFRIKGVRELV